MSVFCLSCLLMMRGPICHFPSERLQLQSVAAAGQAALGVFICPGRWNAPVTATEGLFTQGDSERRVGLICSQIPFQTCLCQGAAGYFTCSYCAQQGVWPLRWHVSFFIAAQSFHFSLSFWNFSFLPITQPSRWINISDLFCGIFCCNQTGMHTLKNLLLILCFFPQSRPSQILKSVYLCVWEAERNCCWDIMLKF